MISKKIFSKKKLALLFSATLSTAFFIPSEFAFAAEEAKSNESVLNYLESEDFIFAAERIPTNKWDTPANIHIITSQEIEENHYKSVEEALRHVNGIVVSNYAASISDILMNGDYRILLLIDGRRANNSQIGQYAAGKSDMMMIPSMKMIDRIEIVKGGSSALYGTDALGGVVNIITKKGTRNETTLDVSFGSNFRQDYQLTNQNLIGKFGWFIAGGIEKSRPYSYKGTADVLSNNSDYDNNNFFIRMDNRFTNRDSVSVSVTHKGRNTYNDWDRGLYNNAAVYYNFKEGTSTPGWLRYFNNYKSSLMENDRVTVWKSWERMQGIEYQNGWELGRHKVIAGLEWHENSVTDKVYGYEDKKVINKAFYLQDTMRLGGKWRMILGARYDHSDVFGKNWSPKISANYRPDSKTKIYASWGRVYRAPTLNDLYMDSDRLGRYGNEYLREFGFDMEKLRPERGHTETLGAEHSFNDNASLAVNIFQSELSDAIHYEKAYFYELPIQYPTNNFNEKRRGVEITSRSTHQGATYSPWGRL